MKSIHQVAATERTLTRSLGHFATDIKLAHSVFAMPFAMAAFVVGNLPLPSVRQAVLLVLCMVTARTYAMGMNRFLDRRIDRANPRTRVRKIPSGQLTAMQGLGWSLLAGALFIAIAFGLSPLAGYCAAPLLALLALYSVMKHLTWLTHWYLGICLGLAPVAVAVSITGQAPFAVILVGVGVSLWTAGFDILYSLQDREFDLRNNLHSVPGRFGPGRALVISRLCFIGMIAALVAAGIRAQAGTFYFLGVGLIACLLTYEHILVRDARVSGHSRHLNLAFFNMNAYVSIIYIFFCLIERFYRI